MKLGIALALVAGLGTATATGPLATAEPLLIVPGAEYVKLDAMPHNPVIDRYYTHNLDVGRGFFPDATPIVIDYPATVYGKGSIADHVGAGATNLDAAIKAAGGPVIAAGLSQGSVVIDVEAARLQQDPNAPAADQVTFVVFGDPLRGFMNTFFKEGFRIPFVGITADPPVESRYNTIVFKGEYDLWGDFPDRPWNLVALANAMMGSTFVHANTSFLPSDIPPENVTVTTNSLGATTTTYLVPTQHLPLNEPLRLLGVPDKIVDALDSALRPIVDAGYSRNDAPGSTRPYLSHGVLEKGRTSAPAASASAVTSNAGSAASNRPTTRASKATQRSTPAKGSRTREASRKQ